MLRQRNKKKYISLKNKKKIFRLKISDTGYAPNMDYLEYYRLHQGSNEIDSKYFSTKLHMKKVTEISLLFYMKKKMGKHHFVIISVKTN